MRVLLFTGKGGVGKTTTAAATAVALARGGRKVLVLSADPAHSLGDAFALGLTGEPTEVAPRTHPGLFAAHIDTRALVDDAWEPLRTQLRTLLAGAGVDEMVADELTVLPGVEELLALEDVRRATVDGPWEVVVVDCGPTAETLRLLALPEALAGYLERLFPAHRRMVRGVLAGLAGNGSGAMAARWDAAAASLSRLAEQLAGLRDLLADHRTTTIRLVLTPERVVAAETRRTLTALALHGLHVDGMVANRIVPDAGSGRGAAATWMRARRAEQEAVLADLVSAGDDVGVRRVSHHAAEPVGVEALDALADALYGDDDPLDGPAGRALVGVRRTAGEGTAVDSEFTLDLHVSGIGDAEVDLARIGDELAVTVDGRRRAVGLPPVLRRCEVTAAQLETDRLIVVFRPDPAVWMR